MKAGASNLKVEYRRTAEGPIESGVEAARLFVPSGTLAVEAGRDKDQTGRETICTRSGDGSISLPVTILSTTGTSGAAELFTAALNVNKGADLVGARTLARAGAETVVRLPDGRGLGLAYAR